MQSDKIRSWEVVTEVMEKKYISKEIIMDSKFQPKYTKIENLMIVLCLMYTKK